MIVFTFIYMMLLLPFSLFVGGELTYFIGTNLITFILMGYDKISAIKHISRIPERFLLAMCAIGGTIGCILSMLICHHKTEKNSFLFPVVGIFLIQLSIFITYRSFK